MKDDVGTRSSVLVYHGVGECPSRDKEHQCVCISADTFGQQMAFMARHRRIVGLGDLVRPGRPSGRSAVAITFDDGYENVLTNAAPILRKYGFVATVFVPTKCIGGQNTWDRGSDCFPLELMDKRALQYAERHGISIESHGHAHIDLQHAEPSVVAEDLRLSVDHLNAVLGRRPRYLAYPYGRQSAATRAAAKAAGFEDAFLFDDLAVGRFGRERVSIDGHESTLRLRLKTSGQYLRRRRSPLGMATAAVVRRARRRPTYS